MKNVVILGSTGSIGTQTLEVIEKLQEKFNVLALSCGNNIELLKKQIHQFGPKIVCVQNEKHISELKNEFSNLEIVYGDDGLMYLADLKECDIFVVATSTTVAVQATIKAIENKKTIAFHAER
jgi:1-deoxy-D-xylulose-5-phosphate reductoisomerase